MPDTYTSRKQSCSSQLFVAQYAGWMAAVALGQHGPQRLLATYNSSCSDALQATSSTTLLCMTTSIQTQTAPEPPEDSPAQPLQKPLQKQLVQPLVQPLNAHNSLLDDNSPQHSPAPPNSPKLFSSVNTTTTTATSSSRGKSKSASDSVAMASLNTSALRIDTSVHRGSGSGSISIAERPPTPAAAARDR
jgi:hypothetical protein